MPVSAEVLRTHLEYTAWASRRLVEAAAKLTEEELHRDFGTADHSVLGTLVHIFAGDRVWLYRLAGGADPGFVHDSDRQLRVLQNDWPVVHDRWLAWASGLTPEQIAAPLTYRDLKGREWTQPVWQLVLHVVNHGTSHRGQVAGFLRAMGRVPPGSDLIFYYRETMTSLPTPSA